MNEPRRSAGAARLSAILSVGSLPLPLDLTGRRFMVGVHVGTGCATATAVLTAVDGDGLGARFAMLGSKTVDVPHDERDRYERLLGREFVAPGEPGTLATRLANVQSHLVQELLIKSSLSLDNVMAVGVDDPGLWHVARDAPSGYVGLCDAACLAEQTGLNVVDAFPAKDVAGGGPGGPVMGLPLWMLLRDPSHARILLDIGRTTRLTYLPPDEGRHGAERVLSFDVGPGMFLLDTLATQLSEGRFTFDPGGRLAVQGRKIPDLIEHWLADPYFDQPPPRWHPLGVRPNDELNATVRMAIETGWSIRDLLCSATHFIADCVGRAVQQHVPSRPAIEELLITGGGQDNGMLLGEIAARLPGIPLRRTVEIGLPANQLEAAAVAVATTLHTDMVPGNHPAITGTRVPRVLGRLTPGTPAAWQRLIRYAQAATPAYTTLRNAM